MGVRAGNGGADPLPRPKSSAALLPCLLLPPFCDEKDGLGIELCVFRNAGMEHPSWMRPAAARDGRHTHTQKASPIFTFHLSHTRLHSSQRRQASIPLSRPLTRRRHAAVVFAGRTRRGPCQSEASGTDCGSHGKCSICGDATLGEDSRDGNSGRVTDSAAISAATRSCFKARRQGKASSLCTAPARQPPRELDPARPAR